MRNASRFTYHQYEVFRYAQYLLMNSGKVGIPILSEFKTYRADKKTKAKIGHGVDLGNPKGISQK